MQKIEAICTFLHLSERNEHPFFYSTGRIYVNNILLYRHMTPEIPYQYHSTAVSCLVWTLFFFSIWEKLFNIQIESNGVLILIFLVVLAMKSANITIMTATITTTTVIAMRMVTMQLLAATACTNNNTSHPQNESQHPCQPHHHHLCYM